MYRFAMPRAPAAGPDPPAEVARHRAVRTVAHLEGELPRVEGAVEAGRGAEGTGWKAPEREIDVLAGPVGQRPRQGDDHLGQRRSDRGDRPQRPADLRGRGYVLESDGRIVLHPRLAGEDGVAVGGAAGVHRPGDDAHPAGRALAGRAVVRDEDAAGEPGLQEALATARGAPPSVGDQRAAAIP